MDKKINPALRKQIRGVRGCIVDAANKHRIPKRFKFTPNADEPSMILTDTKTKRKTTVPLFAYGVVRQVLGDLF